MSCTNGLGPVTGSGGGFPYGAIYLPSSGGNGNIPSNYSGHLYVENNVLTNNFGGIVAYTDPTRFSGGPFQCNAPLQDANSTYYQNWDQEQASDAVVNGTTAVTSATGFETFFQNGTSGQTSTCSNPGPVTTPTVGMYVYGTDIPAGDTVARVTSANSITLTTAATGSGTVSMTLSTPGGCGLYDLYGSSPGAITGSPPEDYFDNCIWASTNLIVSGNQLSMASGSVTGCTSAALCGVIAAISYDAGIDAWWRIYQPYEVDNIAESGSLLDNVWSDNTYTWTGTGGSSAWQFEAGSQGRSGNVTFSQWQSSPNSQDAGSTFTS